MTRRRRRRRGRRRGIGGRRKGAEAGSRVTQPLSACVRDCGARPRQSPRRSPVSEWLRAVACRPPRATGGDEATREGMDPPHPLVGRIKWSMKGIWRHGVDLAIPKFLGGAMDLYLSGAVWGSLHL
jgi:hypothetical protein